MHQDLIVVRVGEELREAAAARLVSNRPGPDRTAGRRFVNNARALGIDLSLMWATIRDPASPHRVANACLAVVGAGRTATLFISGTPSVADGRGDSRRPDLDQRERVALIDEACAAAATHPGPDAKSGARLAQTLLDPTEHGALSAFTAAGFTRLGELAYLRRPLPRAATADPALPVGVSLVSMDRLGPEEGDRLLMDALSRSYIQTLDCPELAGLRELPDVVESHRAVGQYDPSLWWVVMHEGRAEGCMLLTRCPESHAVELVYLGLGPDLRGRGIGSALLTIGLSRIAGGAEAIVTCAVDTRNTPAQRLYEHAAFERFASRIPLIRPISA